MSYQEPKIVKEPMLGIVGLLLAILLSIILRDGFAELTKPEPPRPASGEGQRLEAALRAGALEFEQYRERIVIEQPRVIAASPATSDLALELTASVRNETGRIIRGLEVRGTVIDQQRGVVSERISVIIPTQQTAIEPNEVINARLLLEGLRLAATHAGARVEVTGVIFD
jgi:hypothetical protein